MSTYATIWAVTEGSYSDYHIVCLFTYEEDAKAHCAERNAAADPVYGGDKASVEEFRLYGRGHAPQRMERWSADGRAYLGALPTQEGPTCRIVWEGDYDDPPKRPKVTVYADGGVRAVARTREAAVKALSDRLAELTAMHGVTE